MDISAAQAEMRRAYANGGAPVMASGLVWILGGVLIQAFGAKTGMLAFFIAAGLVHPFLAIAMHKVFRRPRINKTNPLKRLAAHTTIGLLVGLVLCLRMRHHEPEAFFALFMMVVGARYLIYTTIYGVKWFYLLGITLIGLGAVSYYAFSPLLYLTALIGGAVEIVFALIILFATRRDSVETPVPSQGETTTSTA